MALALVRVLDSGVLKGSSESHIRKSVQPLLSPVAFVLCSVLGAKEMCSEWNRNTDPGVDFVGSCLPRWRCPSLALST